MTGNSCSQTLLNLPLDMFHILVLFSLYSVFLGRWYRRRGNMMTCVKYTHELWLKMTDHDPKICSAAQAILKLILESICSKWSKHNYWSCKNTIGSPKFCYWFSLETWFLIFFFPLNTFLEIPPMKFTSCIEQYIKRWLCKVYQD
jgi:hypothetical protein